MILDLYEYVPRLRVTAQKYPLLFAKESSLEKHPLDVIKHLLVGSYAKCGDTLTGFSGVIHSPDRDGDGHYDNLVTCSWKIQVPDVNVIIFDFIKMDIHKTPMCDGDFLEVNTFIKQSSLYIFMDILS